MDRALTAPHAATAIPPGASSIGANARVRYLALCAALAAVLLLYFDTAASIVQIWHRSATFAHGWVVVPISLWLIWRRRDALATAYSAPCYLGLAIIALAGIAWLLADLASVASVAQFAFVATLQATVLTVLGWRAARTIAFPLAFLFFGVPVGEFLVPHLIDWTANVTTAAVRLSGVPLYREGNEFVLPTGTWSVVEACSGSRYLAATLMTGTLYAYLTYRSTIRRLAFFAVSIVTPLVANWARAYIIVMMGHLSSGRIATGVDHIVYGWVFFGIVIALLFWIGSFWRQDTDADSMPAAGAAHATRASTYVRSPLLAALAVVAAVSIWPVAAAMLDAHAPKGVVHLDPVAPEAGWRLRDERLASGWSPHFVGARAHLHQTFGKEGVGTVGVYIAYYRDQTKGSELVSSANVLVTPNDREWREIRKAPRRFDWGNAAVQAPSSELLAGEQRLLARRFYWIDGWLTANDYAAKAWLALAKLTGAGDSSAAIVAYTVVTEGAAKDAEILNRFAAEMGPAVNRTLVRAGSQKD